MLEGRHYKGLRVSIQSGSLVPYHNTRTTRRRRRTGRRYVKREESQSATEFLTTYGWSILIIASVIVILYSTGAFSNSQLRANPGMCRVARPYGLYTESESNLVGICTGELPETVASFNPNIGSCTGNGAGSCSYPSYIELMPFERGVLQNSFTITAWIYWYGPDNTHCQGIFDSLPSPSSGFGLFGYGGNNGACGTLWINGSYVKWPGSFNNFSENSWQFIVAEYNYSTGIATVYNNTNVFSTGNQGSRTIGASNASTIGAVVWPSGKIYPFNGLIANVQLYNTSLSVKDMDALYKEGVGGQPVDINNLLGWWPLNTNAYDYSGNYNNGTVYNVSFPGSYPNNIP